MRRIVDSAVIFTPDADYSGPASFAYTASDGRGGQCSATVNLDIAAVNDAPVIGAATIAGIEESAATIAAATLLAVAHDVDNPADALDVVALGEATHGTVERLDGGAIRFTPDPNFAGAASFRYTVADGAGGQTIGTATVDIANINDAPVATGETLNINEDTIYNLKSALLGNDTDVDNTAAELRVVSATDASHCSVSINGDGSVHFVPDSNYYGTASFTYVVGDGAGGTSDPVTATMNIASVNDAPVAQGESATLNEDSIAAFSKSSLLANDTDVETPGGLSIANVWGASGGSVNMSGSQVTFTPTLNYNGAAGFYYTVSDGQGGSSNARVNLTYQAVNDAPVVNGETLNGARSGVTMNIATSALLANDTDVESAGSLRVSQVSNAQHGTVSLSGNTVSFTPTAGYTGAASFQYTVADPQGATATATAQVNCAANQGPVATDDGFTGYEDVTFQIAKSQLLSNDRDADDPGQLTVTAVSNAAHGTVTINGTNVEFRPEANYSGPASFRYTVSDPYGASTQATAYLTVNPVNDAPVIGGVSYVALDGTGPVGTGEYRWVNDESGGYWTEIFELGPVDDPYRANGRISASDIEGQALSYSIISAPQHGNAYIDKYVPTDVKSGINESNICYATWPATFGGSYVHWTASPGAWQYFSNYGDTYSGADPFTIRVTDSQGAYSDVTVDVSHKGSVMRGGGGGGCPVVLDLDDDGIELVRPEDSAMFADINDDGWKDRIGWAANDDGVLGYDANNDGRIDILDEVSFTQYKEGAQTDLEGLAGLDSSGDGVISNADEAWSRMGVVAGESSNADGEAVAWQTLDAAGIASIGLERHGEPGMNNGNVVFGTSDLTFTDGHVSQAGDVMFAGEGVPLPEEVAALFEDEAAGPAATGSEADADAAPISVAAETTPPPELKAVEDVGIEDSGVEDVGIDDLATEESATEEPAMEDSAADELAAVRQQALLFNQVCATADAAVAEPLAFVPPQTDGELASPAAAVDAANESSMAVAA